MTARDETQKHIRRVQHYVSEVCTNLESRGVEHDKTKLESPEKEIVEKATPLLKTLVYGSDGYKECLKIMAPALQHHYSNNRHHPEHNCSDFPTLTGMTLLDLLEMLCDWKAATERSKDGSIMRSLTFNVSRFAISEEMKQVLYNTIVELGWEKTTLES